VHAYELRIRGLDDELARTAARWELFAFPDVRDLCHVLANAGYEAGPIGRMEETRPAS
jgi:hypothetical protein